MTREIQEKQGGGWGEEIAPRISTSLRDARASAGYSRSRSVLSFENIQTRGHSVPASPSLSNFYPQSVALTHHSVNLHQDPPHRFRSQFTVGSLGTRLIQCRKEETGYRKKPKDLADSIFINHLGVELNFCRIQYLHIRLLDTSCTGEPQKLIESQSSCC